MQTRIAVWMLLVLLDGVARSVYAQPLPRWRHLSSAGGDLPLPGPSDQQTGSLVCEIDRDGVNDFFIAARVVGPALTWFQKTREGWRKHIIEPDFLRLEAGGACHDIDRDGDRDLVFGADAGDNHVWWWENPYPDYAPDRRWKRRVIKGSGANKHHDQIFGDFDGDGEVEFVTWNQRGRKLLLFEIPSEPRNNTPWSSRRIYDWNQGEEHEGLAAADINGDGTLDLVGGGRWFEHIGDGIFQTNLIEDSYRFSRVAAGQLIQGGPPEVVFAPGDSDGPIRWYERSGEAWIAHDLPSNHLVHGHSIGIGDVNRDGYEDIFSAEMGQWGSREDQRNPSARMRVFYGDGKGNFREQTVSRGFGNHESRLADLDGDGDLDILGKPYNWQTPRVDIWLNNSSAQ